MPQFKKKYKMVLILFIVIVFIISTLLVFIHCLFATKISYGTLHFDKKMEKLYLNDAFIWDTGATGSIVYEENKNKISDKRRIGYMPIVDYFGKMKVAPLYYSAEIKFDKSLNIRNLFFGIIKNTPTKYNNAIGIIGMDVISKANWLVDFNSEKVDVFPQNTTYEIKEAPQLTLKYKLKKKPETKLDFLVCQVEKVLVDAGFNCDIILFKSDIEKINKKYKPVDTLKFTPSGLHSSSPTIQNCYVYDTIIINNICFNNVQIIESESRRLIGFQFFKRFEKVFLDTKKKEFCFY